MQDFTIENIKKKAFRFAKNYIPIVKNEIQKEMDKLRASVHKKFSESRKETSIPKLPENGLSE